MILSGKNFRSLADQTGSYSYVFRVTPLSSSGKFELGFTGEYNVDYLFKKGKVFDRNKKFIDSFQLNQNKIISGNVSSEKHDIFINGHPIIIGEAKPTGKISGFFLNADDPVKFDWDFWGEIPDFSIFQQTNVSSTGSTLTGTIVNNNPFIKFTFFSGEITSSDIPATFSGINNNIIDQDHNFYLTPQEPNFETGNVNLRFYTNFGNIDYQYNLSGIAQSIVVDNNFYLIPQSSNDTTSNSLPIRVSYSNPNGANISVSLQYISGETGQIFALSNFQDTVFDKNDVEIKGFQSFQKFSTGIVSGFDASGLMQTGLGSGMLEGSGFATGIINYSYEIMLTGLGSGEINKNTLLSTFSEEVFSGNVQAGQRFISKNIFNILGTGTVNGLQVTGTINSGIGRISLDIFETIPTGEVFLLDDEFEKKSFSKFVAFSDLITKEYSLIASGFAGPIIETGIFDQNFYKNIKAGTYNFNKNFRQTFNDFPDLFFADSLEEVIYGERVEADNLSFVSQGSINTSIEGGCLQETPLINVSGIFNHDRYRVNDARAFYSVWKRNPFFTGHILKIKRESDGEEKKIYFYKNFINLENIKHFASNDKVFITEWRDQSPNNITLFAEEGQNLPVIITGEGGFPNGILFQDSYIGSSSGFDFKNNSELVLGIGFTPHYVDNKLNLFLNENLSTSLIYYMPDFNSSGIDLNVVAWKNKQYQPNLNLIKNSPFDGSSGIFIGSFPSQGIGNWSGVISDFFVFDLNLTGTIV